MKIESLLKSLIWIVLNFSNFITGWKRLVLEKSLIKSIFDVNDFISGFKLVEEDTLLGNFIPMSPAIIFGKGLRGNNADFAVLSKWAFTLIGLPGQIIKLKGDDGSVHFIFVTDDHTWFGSNQNLVPITSSDWKSFVLNWDWHKERNFEFV